MRVPVGPATYRKKPVEVEAMRFPGRYPDGADPSSDGYARNREAGEVAAWLRSHLGEGYDPLDDKAPSQGWTIDPADGALIIATLEGPMRVSFGDWIIRGVKGEFYPCKPDVFVATYEPASEAP